jgi:hypothetical protein
MPLMRTLSCTRYALDLSMMVTSIDVVEVLVFLRLLGSRAGNMLLLRILGRDSSLRIVTHACV